MNDFVQTIKGKIDYELLKKSFFYTFILGFFAHGYCFANQIASHDALNNLYVAGKWSKAGLGRFFYPVYISLTRGRILLPWLVGILGLFWTALAVYLMVRMLQIKKTSAVVAVTAIAVTNPTVYALAATYLHDFDADLCALFLAVASAYCWKRGVEVQDKKRKRLIVTEGALLLSIAMGIYQSYLSVTITLIMIVSIQDLLDDKNSKEIVCNGLGGIFLLILAAVFYLCEIYIFSNVTGIDIWGNQSYNGLGNMETALAAGFFEKLTGAYTDFINTFLHLNSAYSGRSYLVVHGILAVCMIIAFVWGIRKIQKKNKGLLLVLMVLLPLAMNLSFMLSGGMVHDIMKYAFWMTYLLAVVLVLWFQQQNDVNGKLRGTIHLLFTGCIVLIILGNIQTSNAIYLKKDLEYQSTLSYMTRVAEKIEEQENYVPGETPVLFVGNGADGNSMEGFEKFETITGMKQSSPITFYETYEKYFRYVLNLPLNLCEDERIINMDCVADMPKFPKEGSIQMINDVLVVKLEENNAEN